jgi:hypothetical protein
MAVPNGKAYIHVCPFYVYISPSSGGEGFGGRLVENEIICDVSDKIQQIRENTAMSEEERESDCNPWQ